MRFLPSFEPRTTRRHRRTTPPQTLFDSFSPDDDRFLVALNQLLAERKVIGIEAPDGRMGVALTPSEHADVGAAVQNIVTMNLGDGASITGPIAVGQTIAQSYAGAASAPTDELRQHLENLVVAVGKLVEKTQSVDDRASVSGWRQSLESEGRGRRPGC